MWSDRSPSACPCGSGTPYAGCCGRLHRGEAADTAEQLMRSRYAAFVVGDGAYLFRTWHPRTRPDEVTLSSDRTWTGLDVLATEAGVRVTATGWWSSRRTTSPMVARVCSTR